MLPRTTGERSCFLGVGMATIEKKEKPIIVQSLNGFFEWMACSKHFFSFWYFSAKCILENLNTLIPRITHTYIYIWFLSNIITQYTKLSFGFQMENGYTSKHGLEWKSNTTLAVCNGRMACSICKLNYCMIKTALTFLI